MLLGLVFGTLLAVARLNRFSLVGYPAMVGIEIIRALPVLSLIFLPSSRRRGDSRSSDSG